ncbi:hypothetical protein [Ideonella sp.]|uniref:hypothetical protein n=1 Tax=Ideonella sp. TaxID=1929293 RepID=UPI003BB7EFAD
MSLDLDALRRLIPATPAGPPTDASLWLDIEHGNTFDGHAELRRTSAFLCLHPGEVKTLVILCRPSTNDNSTYLLTRQFWGSLFNAGAHVLGLQDRSGLYFSAGVPALAPSLAGSIRWVTQLVQALGVDTVVTAGSSAGAPGALTFAAGLGAQRCLLFSPVTSVEEPFYARRADRTSADDTVSRRWKRLQPQIPVDRQFCGARLLKAMAKPAELRVHYPDRRYWDREWAELLGDAPGVTLVPHETAEHALLDRHSLKSALATAEVHGFLLGKPAT